jgi:hypothetical protein
MSRKHKKTRPADMQVYILVDWTKCTGLFQTRGFSALCHLVRPKEEVAIGSSYMIPMDFAAVNGLKGEHYRLLPESDGRTPDVNDFDGNRYVAMN